MAFEVPRTVYVLEFAEGTPLAGATVKVSALSVREEFQRADLRMDWAAEEDREKRKAIRDELHQLFLDHLVSWDLERDGVVLGVDLDTLQALEATQVGWLMDAWYQAGTQVSVPLEQNSAGGETSPEVLMNLAEATQSLAS